MKPQAAYTLLIVEDSESDRRTYGRYLKTIADFECQILEAATLEEGIELWKMRSPNLVLVDENLPDGSGLELLKIIQNDFPESKLPVIMLTGQGDAKLAVQAMKLGAGDYLFKEDITETILCRCVINTLNEIALIQKLAKLKQQEVIFEQISRYIQQFSNLEEIYQASVTDIRDFLGADRVIIYQFNPDMSGWVVAESLIPPWIACLPNQIIDNCFQENLGEAYRQGRIFAANDIYQAHLSDCHLQLLEKFQVRANLVVPILLIPNAGMQTVLWGLLIAHQCSGPRIWEEDELKLLQRLSVQLAIAIQQFLTNQQIKTQLIELSESENRFRQLAENIHQVFYLADVETSAMLYISPSYETIWERDRQSLYDDPFSYQETIYFEDLEIAQQSYQEVRLGNNTKVEYRIIRFDGSLRWISDRNFPIRNEMGEIYRVCGIAEDITEQKEPQLQLIKTEKLFREAQRIARLGNWELDLINNYLYWSEEIFHIFEIDPQTFTPSYEGFLGIIHPEDQELVNDAYAQHLRDQIPYRIVHRLLMADGRVKYVQEQCETIFEEDGTPLVSQGTIQDITEIKEAELLLQNLNQSLELIIAERTRELYEINILQQTILDGTELAIISTNSEGLIKTFNRGAETMLGYSAEEIIDQYTPDLFLVPEEMQQLARNLSAQFGVEMEGNVRDISLKTEMVIKEQEFTHIRKDGSHFPVCLSVNPLIDNQQQMIGFLGIGRDITQQKESDRLRQEAEAALRESELRFRRVFESNIVGMIFANFQGEILEANDRFLEIIGYSRNELERGLINWAEMTPPEYRQLDLDAIDHLKEYRSIQPWEKVYTHKNGHSVHVLVGVALLSNEDDTCVCVVMDISDRKQREQENHLLKERLEFVLSANPAVIFTCKPGEDFGATFVSDNIYKVTGYTVSEFLSQSSFWANHLHPEDAPQIFANLHNLFEQGQHIHEYRFQHRDGHYLWVNNELCLVQDEQGNPIEIVGYFADISERKNHELELKNAYEELARLLTLREETLTMREDMSNMIVHDLRNPLTGILLAANIAEKYLTHNYQTEQVINKLNQINEAGKRMQKMIDSLLLMAKLESGKFLLNPVATDLHELGTKIINDFQLMATTSKIQLLAELPPPGDHINIDATILQRVIENLISNALKFSAQNSQIVLTLEYLPDNHLQLQVADQGRGINEAQKAHIFEKFEIGEFKKNIPQIGLGLAFCKLAVEAHEGTLVIAPNQPQGSIFTVEI